jgi:hypothetical protein
MNERVDHPQLKMLVDYLLVDGVFQSTTMVVDISTNINNGPPRGSLPKGGGSGLLGSGGNGLPGGGNSGHSKDQKPRPYIARLVRPWIGSTWNLWYPSWYFVQPPITPNLPPIRKSIPYPIYIARTNLNAHVQIFCKAIHANGENNDADIINPFCFTFHDAIYEWEKNPMRAHIVCRFEEHEVAFYKRYILLDGGSNMNIMMEELQKHLRFPSPKLAPYTH